MLESAKENLVKGMENNDMVGIKLARKMIESGTKKLDKGAKHRIEREKIYIDIGSKPKCAFEKLSKSY